jgi:hypothetical protein
MTILKQNSLSSEVPLLKFVSDWKQLYPIVNPFYYMSAYNLEVTKKGIFEKFTQHLDVITPRGTPITDIATFQDNMDRLVNKRKTFLSPSNFLRLSLDYSEFGSFDGRARLKFVDIERFSLPDIYRILSLNVLRLVNLIDNVSFIREITIIVSSYKGAIVNYSIQERTFVFLAIENEGNV